MKPKVLICVSKILIPEMFLKSFLNWPSSLTAIKRKNQSFKVPYVLACCLVKD